MSEVQDAVIRLTAWLRYYGHQCNMPTFPADIAAVVEAAKYSPECRDSESAKTIERFNLEWSGSPYMQSQDMASHPDGDWCRWEDVHALTRLCERAVLNNHLERHAGMHSVTFDECTKGLCGEWKNTIKGAAT